MPRITPPLLLCLALSACGDAPSGADITPAPPTQDASLPARPKRGARMEFEETEHDFGKVSDVGTIKHSFRFTNTGDRRLIVTKIKASCGCTATKLSKKAYDPGESDVFEVEWKPKGFGKQKKSITIQANAEGLPLQILYVAAEIEAFVRVEPQIVSFGRVRLGESHTRTARLVCADPDFVVQSVTPPAGHFVARAITTPEGDVELEVGLLPTAPWGQVYGTIHVAVRGRLTPDGEPVVHTLPVSCNARVFGEIETLPAMFGVGRVDPGAGFRYEVEVTRTTDVPFTILDAHVERAIPPTIEVRIEALPEGKGNGYRLVLEGQAGDHLGTIRAQVLFTTDVAGEPEHKLSVMGIVRPLDAAGR